MAVLAAWNFAFGPRSNDGAKWLISLDGCESAASLPVWFHQLVNAAFALSIGVTVEQVPVHHLMLKIEKMRC